MSTRSWVRAAVGMLLALAAETRAAEGPNLGREATPGEISGWDIDIPPDGSGLPPGSGTSATGAAVYANHCQSCHGEKGAGKPNDPLVGGQGSLTGPAPVRTLGSYW